MRLWARRWLTLDGWEEFFAARRYRKMLEESRKAWLNSDRWREIRACDHANRERVASAWDEIGSKAERCLDCGHAIVTVRRPT